MYHLCRSRVLAMMPKMLWMLPRQHQTLPKQPQAYRKRSLPLASQVCFSHLPHLCLGSITMVNRANTCRMKRAVSLWISSYSYECCFGHAFRFSIQNMTKKRYLSACVCVHMNDCWGWQQVLWATNGLFELFQYFWHQACCSRDVFLSGPNRSRCQEQAGPLQRYIYRVFFSSLPAMSM